ncbi:ATP:cob(I)alamin adenosyltransferase, partial [Enterococcus faecium]
SRITTNHIEFLERGIDAMWSESPSLKSFVLPGGTSLAAHLHVARTVCRRAERAVLVAHAESPISQELRTFLNRLSDWLFAAARAANA